jgi:transposase
MLRAVLGSVDDIVAMDNLPAHKIAGVRASIEVKSAQFFLLPPYSPPDLNPSRCLPQAQNAAVEAAERTRDRLWNRISELLDRSQTNAPITSTRPNMEGHTEKTLAC